MYNKLTDISKRPFDGKYQVWKLLPDKNCDTVVNDDNSIYVPKLWTILGVFDYEEQAKAFENSVSQ